MNGTNTPRAPPSRGRECRISPSPARRSTALGRFVGQRRQLRGVGQRRLGHPGQRNELDGLAVAEGDCAGLVEQQRVDVARRLDRAARHGQHVVLHQPVHAGDADRREQRRRSWSGSGRPAATPARRSDCGAPRIDGERLQRHHRQQEHDASAPASRMFRAISFGVFCRSAPSTSAIMRSRKVSPGSEVTRP